MNGDSCLIAAVEEAIWSFEAVFLGRSKVKESPERLYHVIDHGPALIADVVEALSQGAVFGLYVTAIEGIHGKI